MDSDQANNFKLWWGREKSTGLADDGERKQEQSKMNMRQQGSMEVVDDEGGIW